MENAEWKKLTGILNKRGCLIFKCLDYQSISVIWCGRSRVTYWSLEATLLPKSNAAIEDLKPLLEVLHGGIHNTFGELRWHLLPIELAGFNSTEFCRVCHFQFPSIILI